MNEIYSPKYQLNAVQARITFFSNLTFHLDSVFMEIERLKQIEEVLIGQVRSEKKG